ncbi:kh domain-containing protein at4g18375 [Phtheirospermum japonicum]|uniref:Kh domain-containing protein at4g18375 n=1 Tax=Phtheirospermum japonicum TaxID=374723 RepID=A0A830BQ28_9LAMI|nr:kh domain-containing protein at4g18375 [Phtheirospermum japonicum]
MSIQVTPAKRPNDQNLAELSGRRKWQKSSALGSDNASLLGSSSSKVIRVLFSASRIGGIIGKGGSTISQIRQETGAKVRVEESVPGCDERVILIVGSDKDNEIVSEQVKSEGNVTKSPDVGENCEEHGESDEKQAVPVADSRSEKEKDSSSVQRALLVVFDKMVDILSEKSEGDEESKRPASAVVRLLVFSGQVGCLLGKAGSVIKQMSSESGAQIRILPKDKLPCCASSSDEVVQISGKLDAIKKALQSVSQQLLENSPRNQDSFSAHIVGPSSHSFGPSPRQDRFPPSNRPFHGHGAPFSAGFHDGEAGMPVTMNFPPEIVTFRLLCSEEKVGGVIGKGGSIVKGLQNETGCEIKILDGEGDSEDRIIIISGPAYPDDRISAPQDAVLRVQSRIFRAAPENKDKNMTAKLLVSSHQIGCLLGKGGSVIAEMRKSTGAYIRILGKDQVPKGAAENEEVVQVNGELEVIEEALMQITSRLKYHFFRDVFPPFGHPPNQPFLEQMPPPPFPSYMARREFSSSETFSNRGPPFNKFDGHDFPRPHDDRPHFGHDFPRPGIPPHISERTIAPWGPQGPIEGPGHMGFPDFPDTPQKRFGGFTGNQPAVITNTKVEVVVPRYVVPAIYGEDGGCLRQIREISDAEITITDPKPGATETVIRISGTPEQTNAAQSLIQAFVISETETS